MDLEEYHQSRTTGPGEARGDWATVVAWFVIPAVYVIAHVVVAVTT